MQVKQMSVLPKVLVLIFLMAKRLRTINANTASILTPFQAEKLLPLAERRLFPPLALVLRLLVLPRTISFLQR
jgi:hypothetical protein